MCNGITVEVQETEIGTQQSKTKPTAQFPQDRGTTGGVPRVIVATPLSLSSYGARRTRSFKLGSGGGAAWLETPGRLQEQATAHPPGGGPDLRHVCCWRVPPSRQPGGPVMSCPQHACTELGLRRQSSQ